MLYLIGVKRCIFRIRSMHQGIVTGEFRFDQCCVLHLRQGFVGSQIVDPMGKKSSLIPLSVQIAVTQIRLFREFSSRQLETFREFTMMRV